MTTASYRLRAALAATPPPEDEDDLPDWTFTDPNEPLQAEDAPDPGPSSDVIRTDRVDADGLELYDPTELTKWANARAAAQAGPTQPVIPPHPADATKTEPE